MVHVGVIGTGFGGRVHVPSINAHPNACVKAIVTGSRVDFASHLASKYGIPYVFQDYRELLEVQEIDLVAVAVPPSLHCEITMAAIHYGKHVLCEKPMALNRFEAQNMCDSASESSRVEEEKGEPPQGGEHNNCGYIWIVSADSWPRISWTAFRSGSPLPSSSRFPSFSALCFTLCPH